MNLIKLLPPILANQIAAGEVIERPSSVVKELIENSLDAGASQIYIDIEDGGSGLIRVRDNGSGIYQEDLSLAVQRHATSKIYTIDDLYCIHSLGFRGEALASIASVARLTLTSRQKSADHAWQIQLEGKDLTPVLTPAAHPVGTTIEVANLFYNVPARRKFMRAPRTEFLHIEEIVKRLALTNCQVGFTLTHNQKVVLKLNADTQPECTEQRIAKLLGSTFIENAVYFEQSNHGMKFYGWFGNAQTARSQNDQQFFYLNGRAIRDKVINHAIRQVSQDLCPDGRFPCYVLYLEIPVSEVDINVHPTKHEVRFKEARLVHDFIYQALAQCFNPTATICEPVSSGYTNNATPSYPTYTASVAERPSALQIREQVASYQTITQPKTVLHLQVQFGRYGLVLVEDHWYIIDCVAALHFIISQNAHKQAQPLLLPISIKLSAKQIEAIENWQDIFITQGIDIAGINDNTLVIRAMPALLNYVNWEMALTELSKEKNIGELEFTQKILNAVTLPTEHQAMQELYRRFAGYFTELLQTKAIQQCTEELFKRTIFSSAPLRPYSYT